MEVPTNNNEKSLRRVVGNDAFDVTSHLAATDPWARPPVTEVAPPPRGCGR
ncbi:hypothetical protein GTY88_26895 [Streptomyces sp. SID5926]|nr:hypothetical protein [Streptomyces sp. SID5926]